MSSLNGFPPISGLEAWQITSKSAFVGMTLLDRPDDRIVVSCASKVFRQTPAGEILYPGPQAFTSAGLQIRAAAGTVTPDHSDLNDLVEGGAFSGMCTTAAGETITATFNVQERQPYTISFFWAESQCAASLVLHCTAACSLALRFNAPCNRTRGRACRNTTWHVYVLARCCGRRVSWLPLRSD